MHRKGRELGHPSIVRQSSTASTHSLFQQRTGLSRKKRAGNSYHWSRSFYASYTSSHDPRSHRWDIYIAFLLLHYRTGVSTGQMLLSSQSASSSSKQTPTLRPLSHRFCEDDGHVLRNPHFSFDVTQLLSGQRYGKVSGQGPSKSHSCNV